jgi:hypothetical protein
MVVKAAASADVSKILNFYKNFNIITVVTFDTGPYFSLLPYYL